MEWFGLMPKQMLLLVHVHNVNPYLGLICIQPRYLEKEPITIAFGIRIRTQVHVEIRLGSLYNFVQISRFKLAVKQELI